jgi:DNA-binding transcriptional ArsR family regulator/uncharacterized protein YndB with AHSA1/START domain
MKKQAAIVPTEKAVWKALADGSRRRMLDLLRQRPRTTGDLVQRFAMSRYGVMKHLRVLEEAGLLLIRRQGRERWNHLNPVPIQEIYRRWIRPFEAVGADGLLRLRDLAEQKEREATMTETPTLQALDIQLEIVIEARPAAVWKALTENIADWWPKDFYVGPKPLRFVVEPFVGGRVYEDWGDGQGVLWATVLVLDAEKKLQWVGDLAPEFGGPARSITSYTLREEGGHTVLAFRDSPYGRLADGVQAGLTEGWKMLIEGCLKPHVEKGTSPERPASVVSHGAS